MEYAANPTMKHWFKHTVCARIKKNVVRGLLTKPTWEPPANPWSAIVHKGCKSVGILIKKKDLHEWRVTSAVASKILNEKLVKHYRKMLDTQREMSQAVSMKDNIATICIKQYCDEMTV